MTDHNDEALMSPETADAFRKSLGDLANMPTPEEAARLANLPQNMPLPTDTKYTAAQYVETYTGRAFYPLRPDPSAVSILDIAHALSNQCRYGGATNSFYSTAQHCVLLADYSAAILKASALECLQILMHDAPEAYLVDVPRPVKQYMPEYRKWDHAIDDVIRRWLSIGNIPRPSFQDDIDSRIIVDEREQLKCDSGLDWGHNLEPLGLIIEPEVPQVAEYKFLTRYAAWSKAVFGKHQYFRETWTNTRTLQGSYHDTATDSDKIADLIEVDLRGGVGRVKLKDERGMLVRDKDAGKMPRAAWKWVHGNFTLIEGTQNVVRAS